MKWILVLLLPTAAAQSVDKSWDPGPEVQRRLASESDGKLTLSFEARYRWEDRGRVNFGREVDRDYVLVRHRLGLSYQPWKWLKVSAMVQDSRVPLYGSGAPNNVRDSADLQESYVELFPGQKLGFGALAGRMMLNYGEGRLIGTPQWGNVARTFDHAHLSYKTRKARWEVLFVSPVKVEPLLFNRPNLGERIWGTYNVLPEMGRKSVLEFYVLRHDQNRIGGFAGGSKALGTDRLGTNTFGARMVGPLAPGWKYSLEGALQSGRVGGLDHHAAAWFSSVTRRWTWRQRPLDWATEYKYASGTSHPNESGTFDQLSPANHDKFGHADLFGWRNVHSLRSVITLGWTKALSFNLMYDNQWLASRTDALYNLNGRAIVRSPDGTAGRHVGQEADAFFTYRIGSYTFGGGYGYFMNGEVVRKLTPNSPPTYAYAFSSYSF
jgi:hypothetical protein